MRYYRNDLELDSVLTTENLKPIDELLKGMIPKYSHISVSEENNTGGKHSKYVFIWMHEEEQEYTSTLDSNKIRPILSGDNKNR